MAMNNARLIAKPDNEWLKCLKSWEIFNLQIPFKQENQDIT